MYHFFILRIFCLSLVFLHSSISPFTQSPAPLYQVEMLGMRFIPKVITVSAGSTIEWKNKSKDVHNVVCDALSLESTLLRSGGTFAYTFHKAGTYKYYCAPHKTMGMTGIIIVQ